MRHDFTTRDFDNPPTTWSRPPGRPLIIGHRGSPLVEPENTLASFLRAFDEGADGIELDVHLCHDGQLAVHHDSTLLVQGKRVTLSSLTLEDLRRLDGRGARLDPLTTVPTLKEVLDTLPPGLVNIELKSFSIKSTGLEPAVATVLRDTGVTGRVVVSSFNPLSLIRMRQAAPEVALGLLFAPDLIRPLSHTWFLAVLGRQTALHPREDMLNTSSRLLRGDRVVRPWTINDVERARKLALLGVQALITDKPGVLRSALA